MVLVTALLIIIVLLLLVLTATDPALDQPKQQPKSKTGGKNKK